VTVLTRPKRLALVVVALVVAFVLSYFGIRNALASNYSSEGTLEGYEKATRLEPGNPENWYRLGNYFHNNLQHADSQRAIQAYRTSLSLSPTSAKSWAELASAYEGEGQFEVAREALLNAKRAYPLSADISWRYGNFLLRIGELNQAFREIGQAVEEEPLRAWEAFSLFQRFDSDDDAILKRFPRQEKVYLDIIWGLNVEGRTDSALKVWDRLFELSREGLTTGRFEITEPALFSLVDQLLSKGSISEAQRVWREALVFMKTPKPSDPTESLVWDGGFETDIVNGGLSWHIDSPPGSAIRFSKRVRHSGARALEIKFDGKHNVNFQGVCQLIVVNPETTYNFSAWLRTDNITTDRGIFFRLSTGNNASEVLTPELTGTHAWTQFNLKWTAPKDVRLLQICVVRGTSQKLYSTIAGTVWVDDVELIPVRPAPDSF
jgi:tetratricopeptide (TPR) repeat protein